MHEYKATQEMHMRCSLLPLPQLVPSFHTDALPTLHLMREERRHIGIFCFLGYQNWLKDPTLRNDVCSVWSKPYLCHLLYPEPQHPSICSHLAILSSTFDNWLTDRQTVVLLLRSSCLIPCGFEGSLLSVPPHIRSHTQRGSGDVKKKSKKKKSVNRQNSSGTLNWGGTAAAMMFQKQRCCGGKHRYGLREWNVLVHLQKVPPTTF